MNKNFITVNWSASEMNPWTSELEVISACGTGIICKPNDSRLKTNDFGNVFIPAKKSAFDNDGDYVISKTDLYEMIAYVEYSEVEKFIEENNYKLVEHDLHDMIVTDKFDEDTLIKDAYYKSNDIKYMINRFEDDLTDELRNMTIGELRDKLKTDALDESRKIYWDLFRDVDTAVRAAVIYLTKTIK